MLKSVIKFLVLLMMVLPSLILATEININDIINRANQASYYAGNDGRSDARMIIVDKSGNKQIRQFVILRKNKATKSDQDFLVVFSRPSDVRGTVFLVNKHLEREDDRWLYLPALDLEKRISAGDKRTSFVGSDFFYEDVSGRNPEADQHQLLSQDQDYYFIRSTPKAVDSVEFVYYQMKIDKETFLPMQIEYFKTDDQLYRKVEVVEVKETQGFPTVMKSKVSNYETGGYTLMEFRRPAYNLGIPDTVFSSRALRKPPKKWLKAR